MDTAAPYAVDEHLRVEALRAAVAFCAGVEEWDDNDVLVIAGRFEAWLLGTVPVPKDTV